MRPFLRFVATACGVSWATWLPAIARRGQGPLAAAAGLAGTAGPAVAAVALTRRGTRAAPVGFASRCRHFKAPPRVWLAALAVPMGVVLGGAAAAAQPLRLEPGVRVRLTPRLVALTAAASVAVAPDGPLGEEPGWRGYALPVLQARRSPLVASLLVGCAWSAWHVPLLAALPQQRFEVPLRAYLGPFTVALAAQSVFHTWLHNASGGSVPVAVLAHSAANATVLVAVREGLPELLEPEHAERTVRALAGSWVVVGLATAALTRGRLGAPRR